MKRALNCLFVLAATATSVMAQATTAVPTDRDWVTRLGTGVLDTIVYSVLGIIMLMVAFKAKDILLPGNLAKQLVEDKNLAIAIVTAAFILGVAIIIAAVLSH
jgi:putative membrane protein